MPVIMYFGVNAYEIRNPTSGATSAGIRITLYELRKRFTYEPAVTAILHLHLGGIVYPICAFSRQFT